MQIDLTHGKIIGGTPVTVHVGEFLLGKPGKFLLGESLHRGTPLTHTYASNEHDRDEADIAIKCH
jgi:hypothetical protein